MATPEEEELISTLQEEMAGLQKELAVETDDESRTDIESDIDEVKQDLGRLGVTL